MRIFFVQKCKDVHSKTLALAVTHFFYFFYFLLSTLMQFCKYMNVNMRDSTDVDNTQTTQPELPDAHQSETKCDSFITTLLTSILVGVAVVMYWRGFWLLLDCSAGDLGDASNLLNTALLSIAIAVILPIIACIIGLCIPNIEKEVYSSLFLQYVLISLFGFTNVAFWRGIWYLCDYFIFPNDVILSCIITIGISLFILLITQKCSSLLAPPILTASDRDSTFYSENIYNVVNVKTLC